MLTGLSELLRYALESIGTQEVRLKREFEFIELYLDIAAIWRPASPDSGPAESESRASADGLTCASGAS